MDKTKIYLAIAVIVILLGIGIGIQKKYEIFSVVSGDHNCADLENLMTEGAGPNECFVYYDANQPRLAYVNSALEKSRSTPVTYANPDGKVDSCTIDTCNSCIANILTCKQAHSSNGMITVCKYDSDCGSGGQCVMGMCRQGSSCSLGEKKCLSDTTYSNCLASGHFSGILYCQSGTSCLDGSCLTPSQIEDLKNPTLNCGIGTTYNPTTKVCEATQSGGNGLPIDNQTLLIGGGVGAAVIVALLLKR